MLATAHWLVLAVVLLVLGLAVAMVLREVSFARPRGVLLGVAVLYGAVVSVFHIGNGILVSMVFVNSRYWIPTLPFLLLVAAIVADESRLKFRGVSMRNAMSWVPIFPVVVTAFLAMSVLADLPSRWPTLATAHPATASIKLALAERLPDGRTIGDLLHGAASRVTPLLAHEEHRVALATGRAVVGLAYAQYTARVWTAHETAAIVRTHGIEQVIFFPAVFDPELTINANVLIFHDLYAGRTPDWLEPRYISPTVQLYDVIVTNLR
jgi:hypothetical protein